MSGYMCPSFCMCDSCSTTHVPLTQKGSDRDMLNTIYKLEQRLKDKDEVIMSQEKERQSTERFWKEKLVKLQSQLDEANKVIEFYGSESNWSFSGACSTWNYNHKILEDSEGSKEIFDVYYGGKRARAYFKKYGEKEGGK